MQPPRLTKPSSDRARRLTLLAIVALVAAFVVAVTLRAGRREARFEGSRVVETSAPTSTGSPPSRVVTTQHPSPEASRSAEAARIVVTSHDGAALPRVRVWGIPDDQGSPVPLGTSGDGGTVELSIPSDGCVIALLFRKSGYQPKSVPWSEVEPVRSVVMEPAATIRGRALLASGVPAPAGTRVLVSPHIRGVPGADAVRVASGGDPRAMATTTDEGGGFSITEVEPGLDYMLFAGGRGLFMKNPDLVVSPDSPPVEVVLLDLYYLAIQLVDEAGQPLAWPREVAVWPGPNVNVAGLGVPLFVCRTNHPSFWMATDSYTESLHGPLYDQATFVWYLSSDVSKESIEGIPFWAHVPAHASIQARVTAFPLSGPLRRNEVVARRLDASQCGSLRVEVGQGTGNGVGEPRRPTHGLPFVLVKVFPEVPGPDGVFKLERALWSAREGALVFESLLPGRYRVRASSLFASGAYSNIEGACDVSPGAEARFKFPSKPWGTLRVEVREESGRDYGGPLVLRIRGLGAESDPDDFVFKGAPFEIEGLRPGEYSLEVDSPTAYGMVRPVMIEDGAVCEVPIAIERSKR